MPPPVAQLLCYGECKGSSWKDWPNYVQELGLTQDHIPALLEMVQDEELWAFFAGDFARADEFLAVNITPDDALWAPLHAWRSLGQLQAAEAVKPLAEVLQKNNYDWCWEELPDVFGLIGAEAIAPLDELLATKINYESKITLTTAFKKISEVFPELRDRCVEVLTRQLSNYKNHHRSLNGALIGGLIDLKALESVAVMEEAYQAKKVDEMFVGSWAMVQVELGLKQASDFTPEEMSIHYTFAQQRMLDNIRAHVERQNSKSSAQTWPSDLPGFEAAEFKDLVTRANAPKSSAQLGFSGGAKPSPKKARKKKK